MCLGVYKSLTFNNLHLATKTNHHFYDPVLNWTGYKSGDFDLIS